MAKGKEQSKGGADAAEHEQQQEAHGEPSSGNKREYLDVWSTGKFRLKLGAAFPQDDGSLKVFLNAMPRENVIVISKANGDKTQKQ